MSAVAATEYVLAPLPSRSSRRRHGASGHAREMYRWMLWFGLPSLVAAVFVALVFATGSMWWIGGAIAGVIGCDLGADLARDELLHEQGLLSTPEPG